MITVLSGVTEACNLDCSYCYNKNMPRNVVMSQKTLESTIRKSSEFHALTGERVNFIDHGGEPFLGGLDYFKEKVRLEEYYFNKFRLLKEDGSFVVPYLNCVQTNLTLLTPHLLDFFHQHDFKISFSLDGPEEIQNKNRIMKNGKSSYDLVMEGVALMQSKGILLNAVCVLTRQSLDQIDELYSFFKAKAIHPKINPVFCAGNAVGNMDSLGISAHEYGNALVRFFNLWYYDDNPTNKIAPLYEIIGNLIDSKPHLCLFSSECSGKFLFVSTNGDVYPCGRFNRDGEFCYGNINEKSIPELLESPARRKLSLIERERLKSCSSEHCDWISQCHAGCVYEARIAGDIMGKDSYCEAYKQIFEHILAEPEVQKLQKWYTTCSTLK